MGLELRNIEHKSHCEETRITNILGKWTNYYHARTIHLESGFQMATNQEMKHSTHSVEKLKNFKQVSVCTEV